ncbi:MAG: hypothetical protein V4469_03970 [Patescibacteria group bacterium]
MNKFALYFIIVHHDDELRDGVAYLQFDDLAWAKRARQFLVENLRLKEDESRAICHNEERNSAWGTYAFSDVGSGSECAPFWDGTYCASRVLWQDILTGAWL